MDNCHIEVIVIGNIVTRSNVQKLVWGVVAEKIGGINHDN